MEIVTVGPGITFGSGITITVTPTTPETPWDYTGDLLLLDGAVDLQTDTGSVDLNP